MVDYAVFIHRLYDAGEPKSGGLDIILDQLVKRGKKILYVESPLLPAVYPYITVSIKSFAQTLVLHKFKLIFKQSTVARLQEVFILLFVPIFYGLRKITCITSDPLSTAPIVLLKRLGLVRYVYYHCVDYSENRFPNKFINFIYRTFLHYGLLNADLVGAVTKRIEAIIKDKGVNKVFYVPNSPSMSNLSEFRVDTENRIKYKLVVTCAGISNKYRIVETIELFKKVLAKFPQATLVLVGSLEFEPKEFKEIKSFADDEGFGERLIFTGQLTKLQNIKEIATAWVGLAFYDKSYSHVNFGDSLKIREYAALGIPIVSDRTTPTSLEMLEWGAGFAVNEPWDGLDSITRLFSDSELYQATSEKALKWAESVDKDFILDNLIKNYLDKHE